MTVILRKAKTILVVVISLLFSSYVIMDSDEAEQTFTIRSIKPSGTKIKIGNKEYGIDDTFTASDKIIWTAEDQVLRTISYPSYKPYVFSKSAFESKESNTAFEFLHAKGSSRGGYNKLPSIKHGKKDSKLYPEKRIALVIGNANYGYLPYLKNSFNDVDKISAKLLSLGFDVITQYDCKQSELKTAINFYFAESNNYDISLLYYAGHGLQDNGINYLLPCDISMENSTCLNEAISMNELVASANDNERTNFLFFIDACRDATPTWRRGTNIIASNQIEAPIGVSIMYSTASGETAEDGDEDNSPFAQAFDKIVGTPGQPIVLTMDRIRLEVRNYTNQYQSPIVQNNITYDFYFQNVLSPEQLLNIQSNSNQRGKDQIITPSNNDISPLIPSESTKHKEPASKEIAVSSISLNKTSLTLEVGGTSSLSVQYMPSDATDKSTTWRSTDRNVVTVSNAGVVTAISAGSAAIIASCGGKDAFCNITVREKNNPVQQQVVKSSSNGNNHNGHEWVDLGLSVLWATCNVGASKPEGYGDYYAWGETTTKTDNQWSTYIYSYDDYGKLTKYCSDRTKGYNGYTDRRTKLELSDDVASQKWGGSWRMPTIAEINELLNNCSWTWTTINGINGYKITSKKPGYTDRSIFLPAAGYRNGTSVTMIGTYGEYWSSSLSTDFSDYACGIHFLSYNIDRNNGIDLRLVGRTVRPVLNKESAKNVNSTTQNSVAFVNNSLSNNYEYVDLGLSVKWATCNIGATKPEGYGNYYAWGETEAKKDYSWSGYRWCNGSSRTLTKYNTDSGFGKIDNKLTLDLTDDVAHVKWGGNWRMPTKAECDELRNNCTWTWTTVNGVNGYRVSGKKYGYTDRSIFLPAAGYYGGTSLSSVGTNGIYWSSTGRTDYNSRGSGFNFSRNSVNGGFEDRRIGLPVRPVCP